MVFPKLYFIEIDQLLENESVKKKGNIEEYSETLQVAKTMFFLWFSKWSCKKGVEDAVALQVERL